MALFIGDKRIKINAQKEKCCLQLYISTPAKSDLLLMSNDDCIFKDSDGLYLTLKEGE